MGAIANKYWENSNSPKVTKVFTQYVVIVLIWIRYDMTRRCHSTEIDILRAMTVQCKKSEKVVFGKYRASKMRTQKRHVLDHLAESIQQAGGAELLFGGIHEDAKWGLRNAFQNLEAQADCNEQHRVTSKASSSACKSNKVARFRCITQQIV